MADGMNRVTLVGNLGADPELRYTQGGEPVMNLRMATTESYLDKSKARQEHVEWHSVTVWGKRGEALSKILVKGSQLVVEGKLRTSSWEDNDGTKRWKTEVVATAIVLAGGARAERDERPAERGASGRQSGPRAGAGSNSARRGSTPHDPETGEVR